eukprot:GHVQ01022457.1.p1 GENE.GHVQ01022457.1~~GHVQ01022457.1.p1  ORF type:complete len:135 (+),score=11.47 GHVQ01022457.1:269-673(+)
MFKKCNACVETLTVCNGQENFLKVNAWEVEYSITKNMAEPSPSLVTSVDPGVHRCHPLPQLPPLPFRQTRVAYSSLSTSSSSTSTSRRRLCVVVCLTHEMALFHRQAIVTQNRITVPVLFLQSGPCRDRPNLLH